MIADLSVAYMRRQLWLARIQAVAIVSVLGEALGSAKGGGKAARPVELEAFMDGMGARWQ